MVEAVWSGAPRRGRGRSEQLGPDLGAGLSLTNYPVYSYVKHGAVNV